MLLFINKPIYFIFYIICVTILVLIGLQESGWIFMVVCLIADFSMFYFNFAPYYHLSRGNDKFEIKKVDVRFLKWPVRIYFFLSLLGLIIGIFISIQMRSVSGAAFFLFFYNLIFAIIFRIFIYSRFFSLVLKNNPTIKDLSMENLYADVREVLMKRIIN